MGNPPACRCHGLAAVTVDGKMVDYANIRMIRRLMSFNGQA